MYSRCRKSVYSADSPSASARSEEHTSELQSPCNLVCRLLLEKKFRLESAYTLSSGVEVSPSRLARHSVSSTRCRGSSRVAVPLAGETTRRLAARSSTDLAATH